MFTRIGFFNFGCVATRPPWSAESRAECRSNRGFFSRPTRRIHIRKPYRKLARWANYQRCILDDLQSLSDGGRVTFVVGLIIEEYKSARRLPYSAAYLWAPEYQPTLVCYKSTLDGSGNYQPCTTDCEFENPARHAGDSIGVLLRRDASHPCVHVGALLGTGSDGSRRQGNDRDFGKLKPQRLQELHDEPVTDGSRQTLRRKTKARTSLS
jgi:hypothetical protein